MAVATALVVCAIAADGGTTPLPDLRGKTSELYPTSVYSSSSSSSCVVSNINVIKTLALLVHAGIFWRFQNPKNSDMDYMIFILSMGTSIYCLTRRTFVESAQNLTAEKSQGELKA